MKNYHAVNIKRTSLSIIHFLVVLILSAQNENLLKPNPSASYKNISSIIDLETINIHSLYSGRIEAPQELINGKEYEPYYTRSKFKPLLFADLSRNASIITGSRRYDNLTLQYDTFLDEVIYTDTSRTINYMFPQIALNKNIIDGFNLYFQNDSIIFKYFRLPELLDENLNEGFYEVVYEGNSRFIIKHESTFYVREGLDNYKYSPKKYISTGNEFRKIKNARDFIRLFGENSGDIKQYLQLTGIKIKKADKSQIIGVLKYYDSLLVSE